MANLVIWTLVADSTHAQSRGVQSATEKLIGIDSDEYGVFDVFNKGKRMQYTEYSKDVCILSELKFSGSAISCEQILPERHWFQQCISNKQLRWGAAIAIGPGWQSS
jgi:hypothetical protein